MPDISKCINKKCEKRLTCYRFISHPGFWQSYGDFTLPCDYYWKSTPIKKCYYCGVEISGGVLCEKCKDILEA